MAKLIGTGANQVPTNADLGKLAYQDAIANGTGTAGQVLQSGGATGSPAWATINTGPPTVVFPSNWASPTNTYTSSGTWSKGSLADEDFVWAYLVGGGGGGGHGEQVNSTVYVDGGIGGGAMLLYTTAGILDGASYSIAAGAAGNTSNKETIAGANSTITLTSGQGGTSYTTNNTLNFNLYNTSVETTTIGSYGNLVINTAPEDNISNTISVPTGTKFGGGPAHLTNQNQSVLFTFHCIFGGGAGYGQNHNGSNRFFTEDTSEYAGNGGSSGANGTYPGGGGGGGGTVNQNGGAGANGNLRVYHV